MFTSKNTNLPKTIIYGILGIVFYVIWLFNHVYITPLLLGLIVATLSYPLYQRIQELLNKVKVLKKTSSLSAVIVLILVCSIMFGIINFTAQQFIKELPNFASGILEFTNQIPENKTVVSALNNIGISQDYLREIIGNIENQLQRLGGRGDSGNTTPSELLSQENFNNIFNIGRQSLNLIFNQLAYLAIFLLSWYNFLVFGKQWLNHIFKLLPFSDNETKQITNDFQEGVRNVIYANFLSGLIHAVICAIAMTIFGIESVFILSVLIFLIGVLPLSPSELGYAIPVLLIFPINPIFALILAVVGELVILWTNYILVPKIIASGKEGNNLLILTSILSGISIFGLLGFIIGPLIIIFIQTLYTILVDRIGIKEKI